MPQDCVETIISFLNLTGALTGLLLRYLSNSRTIRQFQTPHILLLQDLTRSHKKTSDNRGLAFVYSPHTKLSTVRWLLAINSFQTMTKLVILKPLSMLTSSSHYHSKVWHKFLRACWLFCMILFDKQKHEIFNGQSENKHVLLKSSLHQLMA